MKESVSMKTKEAAVSTSIQAIHYLVACISP